MGVEVVHDDLEPFLYLVWWKEGQSQLDHSDRMTKSRADLAQLVQPLRSNIGVDGSREVEEAARDLNKIFFLH